MKDEIYIDDISNIPVENSRDEFLLQREEERNRTYTRYNIGQVKRIIELVYMPHQIEQWNKAVNGEHVHCPTLNEERKEVILEEIMPDALKAAEEVYEAYAKIPKGNYYFSMVNNWEDCKDWSNVIKDGAPCMEISCKRFDGFVTKSVNFWYSQYGYSFFEVPDRSISINFGLRDNYNIDLNTKLSFNLTYKNMNKEELYKVMQENFSKWKETYEYLRKNELRNAFMQRQYMLGETEESRTREWNGIQNSKFSGKFRIGLSRHQGRKFGFYPETEKVSSQKELFEFIVRFLNFKEKGKPFSEWN